MASSRTDPRQIYLDYLYEHRTSTAAALASVCATAAGYPLDSVKSRLQVKRYSSVLDCVQKTWSQEGFKGFYRGVAVPMLTITLVRTASFTIYTKTKETLHSRNLFSSPTVGSKAISGALGGATSGILISVGSCAFELVKVRAQLESVIAASQGRPFQEMTTWTGAKDIVRQYGWRGLYFGFSMHTLRDTCGTMLYFALYDSIRFSINRYREQRRGPDQQAYWLPDAVIPFLVGSSCGIASWLVIYPLDMVKTRIQKDALAGLPRRTPLQVFRRLTNHGVRRLYVGLGVSAIRSFTQHGILWGMLENIRGWIEVYTGHRDPQSRQASMI